MELKDTTPLKWPDGWSRTLIENRKTQASWKKPFSFYREAVEKELERMGVSAVSISRNDAGKERLDPRRVWCLHESTQARREAHAALRSSGSRQGADAKNEAGGASMTTRRGTPEGAVLRLIQDYLLARRILFFRMNVGTMVGRHKGKSWAVKFGTAGMADVLAFPLIRKTHHNPTVVNLRGEVMDTRAVAFQAVMPLWIEAKAPKGEQTPQQISFQKIVEDNGHAYLVARGIEPIEKWLKENQ